MRFGKKLALQVTEDQSVAPYLSHKLLKEAINKIVREFKEHQAKAQNSAVAWSAGHMLAEANAGATPDELRQLEATVFALEQQLFDLVDDDLARILDHIRLSEAYLAQQIGILQNASMQAGLLCEESQLLRLEKSLPVKPQSRTVLWEQVLELRIRSDPVESAKRFDQLAMQYNDLVDVANRHTQHLEINVAGFRKLLKRHEKQIPRNFHAHPTPYFGFHRLVTARTQQLLEILRQFEAALEDAQQRLRNTAASFGQHFTQTPLNQFKRFGAECQMVLEIQKQLKGTCTPYLATALAEGMVYPKPQS